MRARFTELPAPTDPDLTHVLVRTRSGVGYWGRGATVEEAVKNSVWIGSQTPVYVMHVDKDASCDPITGNLEYTSRGPIYIGKVMASKKDVFVTEEYKP